jgi:nicotinamide-nucleotide adenylyltransferase
MATDGSEMRSQLAKFSAALSSFSSSPDTFRVLSRISQTPSSPAPSTLYVLDSSFNPPTRAHLRIATSALTEDHGQPPKRLLLLLATQNADKAPKPAPLEQRLVMMTIFAHELQNAIHLPSTLSSTPNSSSNPPTAAGPPAIDIGLTKCPYFLDKASAIFASGLYPSSPTQVHLVGYDTLIRILNPQYYPQAPKPLAALEPFLSAHRLRVTYRTDAADDANAGSVWGDKEAQDGFLEALRRGDLEAQGAKSEWAASIELVQGREIGEEAVSSTKAREAARRGDWERLGRMVTDGVREWMLQESLYSSD